MLFLCLFMSMSASCEKNIRPYNHWLMVREADCARQLEDPKPENDICGDDLDGTILQPEMHFKMKEVERTEYLKRLESCEKN